jgi:anti-sigma B factor antagonist
VNSSLNPTLGASTICALSGELLPWPCFDFEGPTNRKASDMAMTIVNRDVNGVSVLALDGRIVLGEESNRLRAALSSLTAAGKKKIVLNLGQVKYIDSAGLGTLIASHLTAKNQGASLCLCNLGEKFHEVLQITKLLTIFEVYDTETAAVAALNRVNDAESHPVAR